MSQRIQKRFEKLKQEARPGLITFTTAGDPDQATAQKIINGLPAAGADVIETGMPFSLREVIVTRSALGCPANSRRSSAPV